MTTRFFLILFSSGVFLFANQPEEMQPKYLAFQIFTNAFNSETMRANIPISFESVNSSVDKIIAAIGTVGNSNRKLGFIVGPIAFDHSDEEVRKLIRNSFSIAAEKNIAVGFHIDDSMFWGRLSYLNKTQNNEWLDWNKTVNTGRRLDWSSTPTKVMPQLCLNSDAVKAEVKKRAALIGFEVKKGIDQLNHAGKTNLFIGVIAGWETSIGRDYDTGKYLGYCALTNNGFSSEKHPPNIDEARVQIVKDFINFSAKSLSESGVPANKLFSHTAFMTKTLFELAKRADPNRFPGTYLQTVNFSPPEISFGAGHTAGFTTYPQPGLLKEIEQERKKNGNPPWASAEGTAIDPAQAERGGEGLSMERYLGSLFNHGAVLVNIFGWGVGPESNPFRKIAESDSAIHAYRRFLRGEELAETTE